MERCLECGEPKKLNRNGVCAWRAGCEHRQLVYRARMARLEVELALLDPLPCGHTDAEHQEIGRSFMAGIFEGIEESRRRHPSSEEAWPEPLDDDEW